jgi:hypothetical protein
MLLRILQPTNNLSGKCTSLQNFGVVCIGKKEVEPYQYPGGVELGGGSKT